MRLPQQDVLDLGLPMAEHDHLFNSHDFFVEAIWENSRMSDTNQVVYGSKGSGKSAIRRALCERYEKNFFAWKEVDLDEVSFAEIHEKFRDMERVSKKELPSLARVIWMNALAIAGIEAALKTIHRDTPLGESIGKFLQAENYSDDDQADERIVGVIDRILDYVGRIGLEGSHDFQASEPSVQRRRLVNRFPYHNEITVLTERIANMCSACGKKILVVLDGFDSIVEHSAESRRVIFSGLIDAVHKLGVANWFKDAFVIKALLPQELALDTGLRLWDADKYMRNDGQILWGQDELREFALRRLAPHARVKEANFDSVWESFFPRNVKNSYHQNVSENSFTYILRHTMFRPRQLLEHLRFIINNWGEKIRREKVDPSSIPKYVAQSNRLLGTYMIAQWEHACPGIERFLHSYREKETLFRARDFRDKIKRVFQVSDPTHLDQLVNQLFDLGVFGLADEFTTDQYRHAKFSFVADHGTKFINASVSENQLLCFPPMLRETCGYANSGAAPILPVHVGD